LSLFLTSHPLRAKTFRPSRVSPLRITQNGCLSIFCGAKSCRNVIVLATKHVQSERLSIKCTMQRLCRCRAAQKKCEGIRDPKVFDWMSTRPRTQVFAVEKILTPHIAVRSFACEAFLRGNPEMTKSPHTNVKCPATSLRRRNIYKHFCQKPRIFCIPKHKRFTKRRACKRIILQDIRTK
jgi:hypothetical protein